MLLNRLWFNLICIPYFKWMHLSEGFGISTYCHLKPYRLAAIFLSWNRERNRDKRWYDHRDGCLISHWRCTRPEIWWKCPAGSWFIINNVYIRIQMHAYRIYIYTFTYIDIFKWLTSNILFDLRNRFLCNTYPCACLEMEMFYIL